MSNKITGKEYPLSKIFSSDFEYHIPAYQRPYAWGVEQTETLFDDLYDFFQTEKEDSYFLGSIVLIKEDEKPYASVIDGQQRLTTLSILLAVLASYFKIAKEIIKDNQFVEDHPFTSISAAAAVILGRSANGRREWAKLDGRTIAQTGH